MFNVENTFCMKILKIQSDFSLNPYYICAKISAQKINQFVEKENTIFLKGDKNTILQIRLTN